jgi:sec-independent protein translocase protein TatB
MGIPPPIEMANLGMADSLILMVLALVVFGPRRLPQIGRQIGKLMYEFRKASNDFKYQMEEELRNSEETDRRTKEEERLKALAAPVPAVESVNQVQEAGTGAPTPAAVTSPYPGEIEYPAGASVAVREAPAEEPYPRIQPPATGEQVQAAAPFSPAADPAVTPEPGTEKEQAKEQQPAATEPVANHG